ncbi:C-type lectin domain family 2 member B-like isoform X2 [Pelecanus crispus]|uniref:C-type lectin domain family 2 member B-like isoform X2 n=1 Tax=Pelecanus crispus TaxID=36300 RepID=UPI003F5D3C19
MAGRHGGNPDLPAAGVLGCPEGWVGYRKVCYYLSTEKGSWEQSQEQCSSLGASLAVLKMGWEMEFVLRLKGSDDYWVGLRRRGERLEWVDGSSFNQTIVVHGQEPCLFLNDRDLKEFKLLTVLTISLQQAWSSDGKHVTEVVGQKVLSRAGDCVGFAWQGFGSGGLRGWLL